MRKTLSLHKHFTAYDPVAKWTIGRVSAEHSATGAKSPIDKLISEAPFAIGGIQVDGGGEFKSVFLQEGEARGLELFILPLNRPDLNGCVEFAQSTWRYEFHASYELPHRIDKLQTFGDAFANASTTTGRATPLADIRPPRIFKLSA